MSLPANDQSMSVTIPDQYKQLRAAVPFDSVSIGYASIHLAPAAELKAAQQGYSIVPEGDETDWRDEWVVIGYEGMCGDPIFIDTDVDDYPVYTAAHGMVSGARSLSHSLSAILLRFSSSCRYWLVGVPIRSSWNGIRLRTRNVMRSLSLFDVTVQTSI
jgi:hypothetical protein